MRSNAKSLLARLLSVAQTIGRHMPRQLRSGYRRTTAGFIKVAAVVGRYWLRLHFLHRVAVGVIVLALALAGALLYHLAHRYDIAPDALSLLSQTSVETKLIHSKDGNVSYSASSDSSVKDKLVLSDPTEATNGKNLYEASLDLNPGKGLTFSQATAGGSQLIPSVPGLPAGEGKTDKNAKLSFTLTPLGGGVQQGRYVDNRLQYPSSAGQRFYTFRKNGVAEDILLTKAPGDTAKYQWRLNLPASLEARMMSDGSVGVYSANPDLFGDIQVGDTKSQTLLDKARRQGKKDTLAFVLPAPFVKTADGKTDATHTKFSLDKNILTLTATSLKKLTYPLSIDPSVVVNTTGGFQLGYDDGMIDYGNLNANAITRNSISAGTLGTWGSPTTVNGTFSTARKGHGCAVYNGYIYVGGGNTGAGSNLADIQYAAINSDGTLGAWVPATNGFPVAGVNVLLAYNGYMYARGGAGANTAVYYAQIVSGGDIGAWTATSSFNNLRASDSMGFAAYNGYIYIVGGQTGTTYYNDVQFAHINADGTLGTWHYTHNSTDDGTTFVAGFTNSRRGQGAVVYNGYMYIAGGYDGTNLYNDTQYAPINADGTIGAWTTSSFTFSPARTSVQPQIANGYLYIIGGEDTGQRYNTVQYAPINPNGSIGSWQSTNNFTTAVANQRTVYYNGYLYVVGGQTGGSSATNTIQYTQIQPMGAAGPSTQQTGAFVSATGRGQSASVVYSGYLYIIGGKSTASASGCDTNGNCNDVQRCPLNADGSTGTCVQQASAFASVRNLHSSVINNGYLYVMGGQNSTGILGDVQFAWIDTANGGQLCLPSNHATCTGTVFSTTNSLPILRDGFGAAAYNGYMYIVGGFTPASTTGCTTGSGVSWNCDDILYAPFCTAASTPAGCPSSNWQGAIGSFNQQTNAFSPSRNAHSIAVYNGYMYIIGGSSTSGTFVDTLQFAPFCTAASTPAGCPSSNWQGTLSTFNYTCNGSSSGSSCSALPSARYGFTTTVYNGNLYIIGGGTSLTTNLNEILYCPLNSDGTVGTVSATCTATTSFTTARHYHGSVLYNGYLYVVGGVTNASATGCTAGASTTWYCGDIQRLWLGQMGQAGSWSSTSSFTTGRYLAGTVAVNGYLYEVGGCDLSGAGTCTTSFQDAQYAPLNPDGTVGTWNSTSSLNHTSAGLTLTAYKGYLYASGGFTPGSAATNDVQFAKINPGGTLGVWNYTHNSTNDLTSFQGGFTTARFGHTSIAYNGYLYILGGAMATFPNTLYNDVQYAPINSDGTIGTWNSTASFTTSRFSHQSVVMNGYVYVAGGNQGTAGTACNNADNGIYCNDVQYAKLSAGGGIASDSGCGSSWCSTTSFNVPRYRFNMTAYDGNLYIFNGAHSTTDTACWPPGGNTIYCGDMQYAAINSNGTVGPWTNTTIGPFVRQGSSTVAYDGYLYMVGGQIPNANTSCNSVSSQMCTDVQYIPLSTSPQLADYERTLDTGSAYNTIDSISYTGSAVCGAELWYATAGSNGQFGAFTILPSAFAGTTYTIGAANQRYILVKLVMDDQTCGGQSDVSAITVNYHIPPPANPNLITPAANARGQSLTPAFTLNTTDTEGTYLQYKILVCSDPACSTVIKTATQITGDTGYSQTGWSGQDANGGTAYAGSTSLAGSTVATYTYNGPSLSYGTQYYWQAYAEDISGSATLSGSSGIQSFYTDSVPPAPTLNAPANNVTGITITPILQLSTTDADSDYVRYKIDICTTNNCSSVQRTIDETVGQAGWSAQDANGATAYTTGTALANSRMANYTYQFSDLLPNHQYWWRAYAIDPAGTNTFSPSSSISGFTTASLETRIQGGTIKSGRIL